MHRMAIVVQLCICFATAQKACAELHTWTSHDGRFSIQANFVRLGSSNGEPAVVLRKEDGASLTVPLEKLDKAAQELATRLARPRETAKPGGINAFHSWRNTTSQTVVRRGKLVGWDIPNRVIVLETPEAEWKLILEPDLAKGHQELLTRLKAEGQSVGIIGADEFLQLNTSLKAAWEKQNAEIRERHVARVKELSAGNKVDFESYFDDLISKLVLFVNDYILGPVLVNDYKLGPFLDKELYGEPNFGPLGEQRFILGDRVVRFDELWEEIPKHKDVKSWCQYRRIIFPKYAPWPSGKPPTKERLREIADALIQHATAEQTEADTKVVSSLRLSPDEARVVGSALIRSLAVDPRFASDKEVFMRDRIRLALAAIAEHTATRAAGDIPEQRTKQMERIVKELMGSI